MVRLHGSIQNSSCTLNVPMVYSKATTFTNNLHSGSDDIYHSPFSLACVSSETRDLHAVFFRIYDTKEESLCQAFLAETVETGNKNRCVTEVTHVLRRKLRKD